MKAGPHGLINASEKGNIDVVKALLSAGADTETKEKVSVRGHSADGGMLQGNLHCYLLRLRRPARMRRALYKEGAHVRLRG